MKRNSYETKDIKNMITINPATKYIVFSRPVSVLGKTSERRHSRSMASSDNAVRGQTQGDLSLNINQLGHMYPSQLGVAAFANGVTISGKPRLDLTRIPIPECGIFGCRVNNKKYHESSYRQA